MDSLSLEVTSGRVGLILIGLYAVLSVALAVGLQGVVNRVWRAGLDSQRELGGLVVGAKMLLTLGFGGLLAARAVQQFALGHVFHAVVTLLVFLLGAMSVGRDVVGCAVLTFSTRVRIGDRMSFNDLTGTVRQIGLLQTTLRDAAGTKLVVPNRQFLSRSLALAKTKHSVPLNLTFALAPGERTAQLSQRVRAIVLLSPFRSAHSTVLVSQREGQLHVQLEVWSPRALSAAEEQLDSAVRLLLIEGVKKAS